jgi:hypothetical protein
MSGRALPFSALLRRDVEDGGIYCIAGKVREKGVVGQYRVRLHDQQSGRAIRETWSESDGDYSFINLDTKPKYVIALDHTSPIHTADIVDNVVPS